MILLQYAGNDEMFAIIGVIGGLIGLVIGIGILVAIILLLQSVLNKVPPEYREMEPGMIWLLLIPCFNIVWNFFVYPKVSNSLRNYFYSIGRSDVGDCGAGLGLAFCILSAVSIVPYLNCLTSPAALVILIIYFVKIFSLKNQIGY